MANEGARDKRESEFAGGPGLVPTKRELKGYEVSALMKRTDPMDETSGTEIVSKKVQ